MSETVNQDPPAVIEGDPPEAVETEQPAPPPKPPTGARWAERRIQDLVAERNAERAARERAEQELARVRRAPAAPPAEQPEPPAEQPEPPAAEIPVPEVDPKAVDQRAEELVRIREFNQACDNVFAAGVAEFTDFEATLANYKELGGLQPPLIEAVLEIDRANAHKILYDLGKDQDKAYELMRLRSPIKLAAEVAKLAEKYKPKPAPKPVSKAPPPPDPLRPQGGSAPAKDPREMSTAEWMAWRQKNKAVR